MVHEIYTIDETEPPNFSIIRQQFADNFAYNSDIHS